MAVQVQDVMNVATALNGCAEMMPDGTIIAGPASITITSGKATIKAKGRRYDGISTMLELELWLDVALILSGHKKNVTEPLDM